MPSRSWFVTVKRRARLKNKSPLLFALTIVAVACGDAGAPFPNANDFPGPGDDGPPPPSGDREPLPGSDGWRTVDLIGDNAKTLGPDQCWDEHDCQNGQGCMHSEFFRRRANTPGSCLSWPPSEYVGLMAVSPVRFTGTGGSLDPKTDDFVVESGTFDITFMADQDGGTSVFDAPGFALPVGPVVGFEFGWQLGIYVRVFGQNDPDYDIECNVAFLSNGDVVGGVAREPGKVLCSTNNWQSPQDPGAPGLLIEYERCAGSETAWTGSAYCPPN
jgi:hypothetical protein